MDDDEADRQWETCEEWFQILEGNGSPDDRRCHMSFLDGLRSAWQTVSELPYVGEMLLDSIPRGRALREWGESPLIALMRFADAGVYPPPELMLTVADAFNRYLRNDGAVSLEHALIGAPGRGRSNYARSNTSRMMKKLQSTAMGALRYQGKTEEDAAADLAERMGWKEETLKKIEPDSAFGPPPERLTRRSHKAEK